MSDDVELVEHLASRFWERVTGAATPYADLSDSGKAACRALAAAVLADIRAWEQCPHPRCIAVRDHRGGHVLAGDPAVAARPEPDDQPLTLEIS